MNQLTAMVERGVRCLIFDDNNMEIVFENGLVLPVHYYTLPDYETIVLEPVDGGYAYFGNEGVGFGYYKIKLITEVEYAQQLEEAGQIYAGSGARHEAEIGQGPVQSSG